MMSGTCTGSSVMAVRPTTPSPLRITARPTRRALPIATRCTNPCASSSYSKTVPPSSPESWTARETMVLSTVSRSSDEDTACPTSPRAVSWLTERWSSAVRACSSLSSRAFSTAMTA